MEYYNYYYLVIIGFIITLVADIIIKFTYSKYKSEKNSKGISGFEAARKILDKNGLKDVLIVEIKGNLTDHYDPTRKVLRLSSDIFNGETIAAVAVAAHESGHAIQDKVGYTPMKIRSAIVPLTNFCTKIGYIAVIIGILSGSYELAIVGIILLLAIIAFHLITLPVEFNASYRAIKELEHENILNGEELNGGKKMLIAAAFTYVASLISTILQILRLFLIAQDRD